MMVIYCSKNYQITGVSGYIGFQTLVLSLEAGYTILAAVRKSAQIEKLSSHKRVQPYINKLTFVVIPDLTNIEDLVHNLKGVDAILHLASPLAIEVRLSPSQNYFRKANPNDYRAIRRMITTATLSNQHSQ